MKSNEPIKIEFHEQAVERFTELAQSVLTKVGTFGSIQPQTQTKTELHPVANFSEKDMIAPITWNPRSVNGLGQEGSVLI